MRAARCRRRRTVGQGGGGSSSERTGTYNLSVMPYPIIGCIELEPVGEHDYGTFSLIYSAREHQGVMSSMLSSSSRSIITRRTESCDGDFLPCKRRVCPPLLCSLFQCRLVGILAIREQTQVLPPCFPLLCRQRQADAVVAFCTGSCDGLKRRRALAQIVFGAFGESGEVLERVVGDESGHGMCSKAEEVCKERRWSSRFIKRERSARKSQDLGDSIRVLASPPGM